MHVCMYGGVHEKLTRHVSHNHQKSLSLISYRTESFIPLILKS